MTTTHHHLFSMKRILININWDLHESVLHLPIVSSILSTTCLGNPKILHLSPPEDDRLSLGSFEEKKKTKPKRKSAKSSKTSAKKSNKSGERHSVFRILLTFISSF